MEINFDKDYLRQLYEEGKTTDKKHRFQPNIVARYQQEAWKSFTSSTRFIMKC